MKVTVRDANYKRGLYVFESDIDGYGVFELLGFNEFEKEEILIGDFRCRGKTTIARENDGKKYEIFIEDYGSSLSKALQIISNK